MRKEKILTVDDDPDILDVLDLTLSEHYEVFQATNGVKALEAVHQKIPDLILCDNNMPVMNGREFCKTLKKDILLRHVPIIMLTGQGEVKDRIGGIEAGVDDYIIKPFSPDELLARIKMILRRTVRSLDANPLTHLPGNTSIMEEIDSAIREKRAFAMGYADLDQFKAYNDIYGFERGDEIIRETARVLIKNVREFGGPNTFVGHIGGDDFVFLADDKDCDKISKEIVEDFKKRAPSFYNEEDAKQGYIMAKNRQGDQQKFDLIGISIGIVSNVTHTISHVAQIGEIGAELKKYAKSITGSCFVRDKRTE